MTEPERPERKKTAASNCDFCAFYEYDEEDESYSCSANLDEDEMYRFLTSSSSACPFYRDGDEYEVGRHQL